MTFGQKLTESRKGKGFTQKRLGDCVGLSQNTISGIEKDEFKGGPDAEMVVRLAEALEDESILLNYLENNPVYKAVIPKLFSDLNNIRRDPAIIFTRLAKEFDEGRESALVLAEIFSNADPKRVPHFEELFKKHMEQIIDPKRAIEIAEQELVHIEIMTKQQQREIYETQQEKCIRKGHHDPAKAA